MNCNCKIKIDFYKIYHKYKFDRDTISYRDIFIFIK